MGESLYANISEAISKTTTWPNMNSRGGREGEEEGGCGMAEWGNSIEVVGLGRGLFSG